MVCGKFLWRFLGGLVKIGKVIQHLFGVPCHGTDAEDVARGVSRGHA